MSPFLSSRGGRFLATRGPCLSAESEAWGAIRPGGLADHVIVWTNCFWRLLWGQTSWPSDMTRNKNELVISTSLFCKTIVLLWCYILPVLAWTVLRHILWRSTTQNPSSCLGILCLPLGQRLHLLRGTSRWRSISCCAVVRGTFQDSNLWWGCCRQRVILDYNSSSNRWATRPQLGFPIPINSERGIKLLEKILLLLCNEHFSVCLLCFLIYFQFSLKPSLDFLWRHIYKYSITLRFSRITPSSKHVLEIRISKWLTNKIKWNHSSDMNLYLQSFKMGWRE